MSASASQSFVFLMFFSLRIARRKFSTTLPYVFRNSLTPPETFPVVPAFCFQKVSCVARHKGCGPQSRLLQKRGGEGHSFHIRRRRSSRLSSMTTLNAMARQVQGQAPRSPSCAYG